MYKHTVHGFFLKIDRFDSTKIPILSTYFESPYKELLNEYFSFEIDHSKLKLWTLKDYLT